MPANVEEYLAALAKNGIPKPPANRSVNADIFAAGVARL